MTKICIKCKENKALEEYYKRSDTKDGNYSECKSCFNIRQEKYRAEHKLQTAEYNKKYCKSEEGKLANIKYKKSDKGKLVRTKVNAKYKKSDKGKLTEARYNKTDGGKSTRARINHNRRINIANTRNTLTDKEFNYIISLQDNKCVRCDRTFTKELVPTRDHINSVKLGGDFTKETVQALCQSCNSRKGIRHIDYRSDYHKELIAKI